MKIASLSALVLAATVSITAAVVPRPRADEPSPAPAQLAEMLARGEAIYAARCKECHGAAGGGFVGPKLAGNDRLANAELVLRQINGGSADMPAFRNKLTPEEILAVGTYIRASWGNAYGPLAP
jgi:mono/diheme cytochrome c family protein